MEEVKDTTIINIDPVTFEYQEYSEADTNLIIQTELDTVFDKNTDYIEFYVFDQTQNYIYPSLTLPYLDYRVLEGDVVLEPVKSLEALGFEIGTYNVVYNFYKKRLASNTDQKYFIAGISSDRTEIRLDSNVIANELIISSSNAFIQFREEADYFVDFYLNFGQNQTLIANNIKLEVEEGIDPTILIKLYDPLPDIIAEKDELWVVELLSTPQAYQINFPFVPVVEDDFTYISGPDYSINVTQQTSKGSDSFSIQNLLQSDVTSSINQIQNLLNQKEVNINVDYENFANFVHFSSAKTRLENFAYKVALIESSSNELSGFIDQITGATTTTAAYSSSRASITGRIDNIIKNFDGYEYFLYFNSGSQYSYPKLNNQPPFVLAPTGSTQALNWLGNSDPGSSYYGGQALSASNFDFENRDYLYWTIPEYLREDPANQGYELFVDMAGQYYDNVWLYTKDISNKFDADNRLEYGISKDLVADAIRDFGVKLYSSNFNNDDLFTAFLGLTPSGSDFPFPNITGSVVDGSGNLDIPSGFEYVDTKISASNDIVPLNNVQKQIYKRVYHNIPYLLKTKGTIAGIRALITSYGIPDTILRISEFGGKDRNESQDYDLKQDVFNYALDTGLQGKSFVSSSFRPNSKFNPKGTDTDTYGSPNTIQFRFKPARIPTASNNVASSDIIYSQSLWLSDQTDNTFGSLGAAVVLEYTGSGFVSGSYSGSIASPYDNWGTLKFYPDLEYNPTISASLFFPFFNEDWWSVQFTFTGSGTTTTGSLFAANEIDGKIGFSGSDFKTELDARAWYRSDFAALNIGSNKTINSEIYEPFSGSFQEYRMFIPRISESKFFDYTVNSYSDEGNTINSTPNELLFRAALGTQLDTGSRTSIHPRVTGSTVQITQSFADNTSTFYTSSAKWVTNVEDIFQDQVPAGIKNRITNKIQAESLILAEAPYGFQTTTSSTATISSPISDVISPIGSIQQTSFVSQSYTPSVNYLEVGFSPSNQINDDINAQLGYFNLGDYIGDPRFVSSSLDSYPNLDRLRDAYFEKYIRGYDIVDFVRLIKFFDNSLFKMIKDFTPARMSLASGVVVKQHLLERNRKTPPQASSSLHDYEGLVVNLPKNYSSGSSDFPQYSTSGSALYKFTGGTGGSFERFNSMTTYPSGSKGLGPNNRFGITQSWDQNFSSSVIDSLIFNQSSSQYISASGGEGKYPGPSSFIKSNQSEFYDGIFSGSYIQVEDGILNPNCGPYLSVTDQGALYKPVYYSFTDSLEGSVTSETFVDLNNIPPLGFAWIGSSLDEGVSSETQRAVPKSTVKFIKLAKQDINGLETTDYLQQGTTIILNGAKYYIQGVTNYSTHTLLNIGSSLDANVTSSIKGGQEDYTLLDATGSYSSSGGSDLRSQGYFHDAVLTTNQNIFYYGDQAGITSADTTENPVIDVLGFFNPGSSTVTTQDIINNPGDYSNFGGFTLQKTPNTPLAFSCSFAYSASELGFTNNITSSGIYASASSNLGTAYDQQFTLGAVSGTYNSSSIYRPAPHLLSLQNTQFQEDSFGNMIDNLIPGNSASWYDSDAGTGGANPGGVSDTPNPLFVPSQEVTIPYQKPNTTNLAGNAQVISPGTASFDFHFPKLEFNQTTTPAPDLTFGLTSLSGSTLSSNNNFFYNVGGQVSNVDITTFDDVDGAIGVNMNWFHNQTVANNDAGGNSPATGNPITNATVLVQYTIIAPTGTNISASAYGVSTNDGTIPTTYLQGLTMGTSLNTPPSTPLSQYFVGAQADFQSNIASGTYIRTDGGDLFGNGGESYMTENGTTGRWEVTASFSQLDFNQYFTAPNFTGTDKSNYLGSSNNSAILYIKPFVKGSELFSFNYQIKDIKIIPQFSYPTSTGPATITGASVGAGYNWSVTSGNSPIIETPSCQGTSESSPTTNVLTVANNSDRRIPNTIDVTARLMKLSGSADSIVGNIPGAPQLITSSATITYTLNLGTGTAVAGGGKFGGGSIQRDNYNEIVEFPDSPILDILHPYHGNNGDGSTNWPAANPANLGNGSTINQAGDIYYMEFSMSNFDERQLNSDTIFNWNDNSGDNIGLPPVINTGSKLIISQSINGDFGGTDFVSASIYITKNTPESTNEIGSVVANGPVFNSLDLDAKGTASFTGSMSTEIFDYALGDTFRMGISLQKTFNYGLDIGSYSFSIFNSSSIWSDPLPSSPPGANIFKAPIPVSVIIPTFVSGNVLPFSLALDCQPLLNNFVTQRLNPYLMDIDYNWQSSTTYFSSSIAPVNIRQILTGNALRAATPESNYTQIRSINPRYNGAKSTSQQLNVWNVGDTGTFGKNPTVELKDAFFGYFNDLDDPYPNINNLTRVNLNYLIDEQGNALPPSLNQLSIDTFEQVFPTTTVAKIAPKSGKNNFRVLGTPAPVSRLMQYLTPIMYSQNAGNNYANIIPLSGSGYISRYDNDDGGEQIFSGFNALGAPSTVTTTLPVQSVDYIINPKTTVTSGSANTFNPLTAKFNQAALRPVNGVAFYPINYYNSGIPPAAIGQDLPNEQIITLQNSIVTSYVSETKKVRDELQFELHMYTGSIDPEDPESGYAEGTETSFNIEDITCTVYTDDGRATDIGSVLTYGWFSIVNIVDYEKRRRSKNLKGAGWSINRWKYSYVPVPTGGIRCIVDWEMYETLFDLGLMRKRKPKNGAGVLALEWNIKANSGAYTIKQQDSIQWRFNGRFKNARGGYQQGMFFPLGFEGQYVSANLEAVGAYDHLQDEANTASAPFWVFSGSSGTSSPTIIDQQFLVMSSSNMNEAYGESFRQADLEYFPSPSPYFPGGIEPKTTRFDKIENTLELQIGDEIRFANNENFTYTIEQVFSPQANSGTPDGRNRLKIKLNKPVDESINKDFFLVRRSIVNPNSLYLDQPFPYDSLASASISQEVRSFSGSFGLTGSLIGSGVDNGTPGNFEAVSGSLSSSFSSLEIAETPGILYPDFPTDYLVQSASIIVNDLISKGIIES